MTKLTLLAFVAILSFAEGSSSCCAPSKSCPDEQISKCVCRFDNFCCKTAWDEQCVKEAMVRCHMACHSQCNDFQVRFLESAFQLRDNETEVDWDLLSSALAPNFKSYLPEIAVHASDDTPLEHLKAVWRYLKFRLKNRPQSAELRFFSDHGGILVALKSTINPSDEVIFEVNEDGLLEAVGFEDPTSFTAFSKTAMRRGLLYKYGVPEHDSSILQSAYDFSKNMYAVETLPHQHSDADGCTEAYRGLLQEVLELMFPELDSAAASAYLLSTAHSKEDVLSALRSSTYHLQNSSSYAIASSVVDLMQYLVDLYGLDGLIESYRNSIVRPGDFAIMGISKMIELTSFFARNRVFRVHQVEMVLEIDLKVFEERAQDAAANCATLDIKSLKPAHLSLAVKPLYHEYILRGASEEEKKQLPDFDTIVQNLHRYHKGEYQVTVRDSTTADSSALRGVRSVESCIVAICNIVFDVLTIFFTAMAAYKNFGAALADTSGEAVIGLQKLMTGIANAASDSQRAENILKFMLGLKNILGWGAITNALKKIFHWYDWVLVGLSIIATIVAWFASGLTALLAQITGALVAFVNLIMSINSLANGACAGVSPSIGMGICWCENPGDATGGKNGFKCADPFSSESAYCVSGAACVADSLYTLESNSANTHCGDVAVTCTCDDPLEAKNGYNGFHCSDGSRAYCSSGVACTETIPWLKSAGAPCEAQQQMCACDEPNNPYNPDYYCTYGTHFDTMTGNCGSGKMCTAHGTFIAPSVDILFRTTQLGMCTPQASTSCKCDNPGNRQSGYNGFTCTDSSQNAYCSSNVPCVVRPDKWWQIADDSQSFVCGDP